MNKVVTLRAAAFVIGLLALPVEVFAYGPGCPWCTNEPAVLPASDPEMHVSVRWCGIDESPSVNDPSLACQSDFKTMMWRRHERAADCIWIPQGRLTLRSGGAITKTDYVSFPDLDTSVGLAGDVETDSSGNYAELFDTWTVLRER